MEKKDNENKAKKNITLGQKIKGHFLLTRPIQLIWFDVFASLAMYAVIAQHSPNAHYLIFIFCAMITDAGACTINDYGDRKTDSLSKEDSRKKRPLPGRIVSERAAVYQAGILYSIGLVVALFLDFYVFLAAFLLVLLSLQYSLKPLKMDGRPVVSQLFWVALGFLYYFAVAAYLLRYENVSWANIYNGIYFLLTMILFAGVAETLAKDLRDLENDRAGGKITTPAYFGVKPAAVGAIVFSISGLIFWAFPYFSVLKTDLFFQILIVFIVIFWNAICLALCISIFKNYTKSRARELHLGFILTLTIVLALTYFTAIS